MFGQSLGMKLAWAVAALAVIVGGAYGINFVSADSITLASGGMISGAAVMAILGLVFVIRKPVPRHVPPPIAPPTKPVQDQGVALMLGEGMDQERPISEQTAFFRPTRALAMEEENAKAELEEKKKEKERQAAERKRHDPDDNPIQID